MGRGGGGYGRLGAESEDARFGETAAVSEPEQPSRSPCHLADRGAQAQLGLLKLLPVSPTSGNCRSFMLQRLVWRLRCRSIRIYEIRKYTTRASRAARSEFAVLGWKALRRPGPPLRVRLSKTEFDDAIAQN